MKKCYMKEKVEQVVAKYTTQEGLFGVFIGTPIWATIVLHYYNVTYDLVFKAILEIVKFDVLSWYFTSIILGLIFTFLGLGLDYIIAIAYERSLKRWKKK